MRRRSLIFLMISMMVSVSIPNIFRFFGLENKIFYAESFAHILYLAGIFVPLLVFIVLLGNRYVIAFQEVENGAYRVIGYDFYNYPNEAVKNGKICLCIKYPRKPSLVGPEIYFLPEKFREQVVFKDGDVFLLIDEKIQKIDIT